LTSDSGELLAAEAALGAAAKVARGWVNSGIELADTTTTPAVLKKSRRLTPSWTSLSIV
jgi:hypothetical protein